MTHTTIAARPKYVLRETGKSKYTLVVAGGRLSAEGIVYIALAFRIDAVVEHNSDHRTIFNFCFSIICAMMNPSQSLQGS